MAADGVVVLEDTKVIAVIAPGPQGRPGIDGTNRVTAGDATIIVDGDTDDTEVTVRVGEVPQDRVTGLVEDLGDKAAADDVADALAGKAATNHGHTETDIAGLPTALDDLNDAIAGLIANFKQNYDLLVQEVVDRQVADGRLEYRIGQRYRFNPATGIPETDLADAVKAKLNPTSGSGGGSGIGLGQQILTDWHVARDAGIAETKLSLASDAHPATPSRRTLGRGPLQAMPGATAIPVPGTDVPPLVGTPPRVPASFLPDGSVAGAPLDTATKPSPLGVPAPGVSTRSSPADHVHPRSAIVLPADHGLITWSFDPAHAASSGTATAGVLQMVRVYIPYAQTVTGVLLSAITAGSGLTNCYTALFDASRNLLGQSANLATLWGTTTGDKKGDLATPVAITTPGFYYAGWWNGGGTSPAWARSTAVVTSVNNWNLAAASARFATANTGLTTTAPATAATLAPTGSSYLVGLY